MTALVVVETAAVLLLGLLVAGLLRSHAEILRRLHDLGVMYGEEPDPASSTRRDRSPRAPDRQDPPSRVTGVTPAGGAVSIAVDRPGEQTLLLFLSSGCTRCGTFWEAARNGNVPIRTVVIARDSDEESPTRLLELAAPDGEVIMSSAAWDAYRVPGSPYAIVLGATGDITGEGTANTWEQLWSLVRQAGDDSTLGREQRADRELRAAGILPGDPSLHSPVRQ
jgi:hypothetical protein